MPSAREQRKRARAKKKKEDRHRAAVLLGIVDLARSNRRDRVGLARRIAEKSQQDLADHFQVDKTRFAHWLNENPKVLTKKEQERFATLADLLGVPVPWLENGSLAQDFPAFLGEAMELGIAVGVVASVQLHSALTRKCCIPALLECLKTTWQFSDVTSVSKAFPGFLTNSFKREWLFEVRCVRWIPPSAVKLFKAHWEVLAADHLSPAQAISGPCELSVYAACGWALAWAQKTVKHARPDSDDHALATQIIRRLSKPNAPAKAEAVATTPDHTPATASERRARPRTQTRRAFEAG